MFNFENYPNRLNLGCGFDYREGYLNVDMYDRHNPDLAADVTSLEMLPSSYYQEIIAQDVLEHIRRDQTDAVLQEWHRLLLPRGKLFLRVPNILGIAELFHHPDYQNFDKQKEIVQCLFGTQAYTGDYHLTAFTPHILAHYLDSNGFVCVSMEPKDIWLLEVWATKTGQTSTLRKNSDVKYEFSSSHEFSALNLIDSIKGLSEPEEWGSWSKEKEVALCFSKPLPKKCEVIITANGFGSNIGKAAKISLGNEVKSFILGSNPEAISMIFNNANGHSMLCIAVPHPISPKSLGINADERTIGIGFRSIEIKDLGEPERSDIRPL